ncbi:hypothetical protein AB0I81_23965 [Nonomuraea sp. NPDC050404]|uniref:hypothetical protein n=1 Tax=Nonomuraea sp. NPDC050404 TaxID=3155783 RepID=UPI0033F3898F
MNRLAIFLAALAALAIVVMIPFAGAASVSSSPPPSKPVAQQQQHRVGDAHQDECLTAAVGGVAYSGPGEAVREGISGVREGVPGGVVREGVPGGVHPCDASPGAWNQWALESSGALYGCVIYDEQSAGPRPGGWGPPTAQGGSTG